MPILKWLLKNWLGVITAIVTGYNLIELRKTKRRRLKVTITRGDKDDGPVEKQGKNLLFIPTFANIQPYTYNPFQIN